MYFRWDELVYVRYVNIRIYSYLEQTYWRVSCARYFKKRLRYKCNATLKGDKLEKFLYKILI